MHPHASPIAVETSENEDHHTVKRPSALHNDAIKQGLWHRKYVKNRAIAKCTKELGGGRVPPHEFLAKTRIASLLVHEGVGRTLKGHDLTTTQQIVKSLKAAKEDREDMLLIFSTFDNRLSDISDLINGDDSKSSKEEELDRFEVVEKMIFANASVFDEPSR
ncbi:hypothetical protein LR48_Vigan11g133800 [Vigna angularis]|uniref:Uncharacterized protein n=1 Tax=Phaseolus angularis TaxID=3914 RepID=A0A0L9VU56_PHAAN|nr:hypothetical protein LR48_Vigan11g133800 [Vigna angularis]